MVNHREIGVMLTRYYSGIPAHLALRTFIAIGLILALTQKSLGYSVLTHEAIVDAAWDVSIKPLLLLRFPRRVARGPRLPMVGSSFRTWAIIRLGTNSSATLRIT
jgi:hypothetical protein